MLIATLDWRAIFLINLPLGIVALVLARRHLPVDRRREKAAAGLDKTGTLLLALTLAAYALAVTVGRGRFGAINAALLLAAVFGVGLFVRAETRAASPLIDLTMLRDRRLSASLAMTALVSMVMMTTLYRAVLPVFSARARRCQRRTRAIGRSAGRRFERGAGWSPERPLRRPAHDRRRAKRNGRRHHHSVAVAGDARHHRLPRAYRRRHRRLCVVPDGQQHRRDERHHADQRGVISGMLNLARNLGLISGASVLGAVFAVATAASAAPRRPRLPSPAACG